MQLVLTAGALAWALRRLARRGVPLLPRLLALGLFALLPFYSVWGVCAHKDVPFAVLCMLFVLQLMDLPQALRRPLGWKKAGRLAAFVLTAVLMLLMRRNGIYALLLCLPVCVPLTEKGLRCRMSLLLCLCIGLYVGADRLLIAASEAEDDPADTAVEMLSVPLQQLARAARLHPEALAQEDWELLHTLYDGASPADYYSETCSDPVKWALSYDELDTGALLGMWLRVLARAPFPCLEATLIQNLPYYLPGASMPYYLDLGTRPIELYELEARSLLPAWQRLLQEYDRTASFAGLPLTRSLGDVGLHVWLCIALLGLSVYRRDRGMIVSCCFLLGIWLTCLLGPVAIVRYMLSFFYATPLLLAEEGWGKRNEKELPGQTGQPLETT